LSGITCVKYSSACCCIRAKAFDNRPLPKYKKDEVDGWVKAGGAADRNKKDSEE